MQSMQLNNGKSFRSFSVLVHIVSVALLLVTLSVEKNLQGICDIISFLLTVGQVQADTQVLRIIIKSFKTCDYIFFVMIRFSQEMLLLSGVSPRVGLPRRGPSVFPM